MLSTNIVIASPLRRASTGNAIRRSFCIRPYYFDVLEGSSRSLLPLVSLMQTYDVLFTRLSEIMLSVALQVALLTIFDVSRPKLRVDGGLHRSAGSKTNLTHAPLMPICCVHPEQWRWSIFSYGSIVAETAVIAIISRGEEVPNPDYEGSFNTTTKNG